MAFIIIRRDDCEILKWSAQMRGYGYRITGENSEYESSFDAVLFAREMRGSNFVIDADHYDAVRALHDRRCCTSAYEIAVERLIDSECHCD